MTRDALYARHRELADDELPRRAREGRWVVTADHCFGRILDAQSLAWRRKQPKR